MKLKIDRAWIRQKTLEEEGYEIGAGSYSHPLRQPEMIMKLQAAIDKLKFLQPGLENSNSAAEDALVDFLPDLIKLLELSATPQSGWRPIEEAPKDGTSILGYRKNSSFPGYQEVSVIHWTGDTWRVTPTKDGRLSHMATHWMPLPQPPKQRGE